MSEQERTMQVKQVPIDFHVPEGVPCQYATNLVVQRTEHEFIISFFQVTPPMLVGSAEEIKARLVEIGEVRAECVARVIVAAGRMQEFIHVLQQNWQAGQNQPQEEG